MNESSDEVNAADAAEASDGARRSVLLRGAVVLGAVGVGGALSRVGGGSLDTVPSAAEQSSTPTAAPTAAPAGGAAKVPAGPAKALGPASKVPVGGGHLFAAAKVVVTQPTAGVYKAFDARCTHQQCLLTDFSGGTINCVCHGAKFSIADGSAVKLPATVPLPAKTVTVAGGMLSVI
jgi:nitrite reductase/ring-hydroxylating ferredoxin subunit